MIDSERLVYLPPWARFLALGTLLAGLAVSLFVAMRFVGEPDRADWILMAMSVSQVSLTALVVLFVVLFSEKDASLDTLDKKADQFVREYVPRFLERISLESGEKARCVVRDKAADRDLFGRVVTLEFKDNVSLKIWVGLNVSRIFAIYFVKSRGEDPADIEAIKDVFRFTFGGAESLGYDIYYEQSEVEGERFVSIWTTVSADDDMIVDPKRKLFWAQDVAMMTQSFLRTALRRSDVIDVSLPFDPRPL